MSMWLSGANSVANRARGQATAAGRRQAAAIAARGMGDALDLWGKALKTATGTRAAKSGSKARQSR